MKPPYQCLQFGRDFLIAARGGRIYTFRVTDGSHISTWRHPTILKASEVSKAAGSSERGSENLPVTPLTEMSEEPEADQSEPPSKRRRVEGEDEQLEPEADQDGHLLNIKGNGAQEVQHEPMTAVDGRKKGLGRKARKQANKERSRQSRQYHRRPFAPKPSDIPTVSVLNTSSTQDQGFHVIAVTGQDKTIWVFELTEDGVLNELSRRTMPKRPSSIAITTGMKPSIICADKFGDVYSLPLLITIEQTLALGDVPTEKSAAASPSPAPKLFTPQANELTVHSKKNLDALRQQRRDRTKYQRSAANTGNAEFTNFKHTLLLGHVSLLTDVACPMYKGRPYLLTADRDEHIRVSRGEPQAHVIETFCLGHMQFVSKLLCIPGKDAPILVSAGGDDDIFVWSWVEGRLLQKVPLLAHVQSFLRGCGREPVTKVAVTGLVYLDPDHGDGVIVTCER